MKGFDVLHLKSAVKDRNRFPELSRTHETSMDIGQINVLFNEELIPSDEIPVKAKFFARTAPLVKPTFGRILFKTVSMFVPYHQVAEDAEAFIGGKTSWLGQTPVLRHITAADIFTLFNPFSNLPYVTSVGASATNYDVVFVDSGGLVKYVLFTNLGRYLNKILNQLGYFIPENVDFQTTSYWMVTGRNKVFSAYPLLAFFKGYNDWMSQSQRFNISQLSNALLNIRQNKAFTGYTTNGHIAASVIDLFFSNLFLNYDNDYFTSAWQNANAPLNAAESIINPVFPSTQSDILQNPIGVYGQIPISGDTILYQRALDVLKSFDDWVRRNNYAGSRDVQQIYARFGIKVDDYRTHYAHVVGTTEQYMNVGDVTATAETAQGILGDYAGKAIVDTEVNVEYKSSDYGLFMILGYITVRPQMSFGFDRKVLRIQPLDWYNPEFDGIGGDPITYREVFESCKIDPTTDVSKGDDVYGFTERYNSYRYGRDQITGDFKVFKDMDVWHCGRDLSVLRAGGTMIAQSSSMNTLAQVDSEYNRIFSVQSGDVDHFYFVCQFEVNALRPMLSLSQVPQLGTGDTAVPRNGNVIN